MPAGESTSNSQFDTLDAIPTRTHALLVEIEKHDLLQWKMYTFFRHLDSNQWGIYSWFRKKAPDMILRECNALHKELSVTIHSSNKIIADLISKSNLSNEVATQIFQATKELLDRLLLNQEQQLVNYSTRQHIDIRKHASIFCDSLKMNITMTNKMIVDLRTKVY